MGGSRHWWRIRAVIPAAPPPGGPQVCFMLLCFDTCEEALEVHGRCRVRAQELRHVASRLVMVLACFVLCSTYNGEEAGKRALTERDWPCHPLGHMPLTHVFGPVQGAYVPVGHETEGRRGGRESVPKLGKQDADILHHRHHHSQKKKKKGRRILCHEQANRWPWTGSTGASLRRLTAVAQSLKT